MFFFSGVLMPILGEVRNTPQVLEIVTSPPIIFDLLKTQTLAVERKNLKEEKNH